MADGISRKHAFFRVELLLRIRKGKANGINQFCKNCIGKTGNSVLFVYHGGNAAEFCGKKHGKAGIPAETDHGMGFVFFKKRQLSRIALDMAKSAEIAFNPRPFIPRTFRP